MQRVSRWQHQLESHLGDEEDKSHNNPNLRNTWLNFMQLIFHFMDPKQQLQPPIYNRNIVKCLLREAGRSLCAVGMLCWGSYHQLSGGPAWGSRWYSSLLSMTKLLSGSKVDCTIDSADIMRAYMPDKSEQIKCTAVLLFPASRRQS